MRGFVFLLCAFSFTPAAFAQTDCGEPGDPLGELIAQIGEADQHAAVEVEIRLRNPATCHVYEVTMNDRTLRVPGDRIEELAAAMRESDRDYELSFVYGDQNILDFETHTTGVADMWSLATQAFGYQPEPLDGAGRDVFARLHRLGLFGGKHALDGLDLVKLPAPARTIIRHTVRTGLAGGTIVQLPDGRLGVATAQHVTMHTPWDIPTSVPVEAGGETFQAVPYMPPPDPDQPPVHYAGDLAILTFSAEDEARLREMGFEGIPIAEPGNGPDRHDPILVAGFGAAGRGPATLNTGVVYTLPTDGGDETSKRVEEYNCNGALTIEQLEEGLWSTTALVIPGDSGGGLFWFNPETEQFELIGVNHAQSGSEHRGGVQQNVDTRLVNQWLEDYAPVRTLPELPLPPIPHFPRFVLLR